MTSRLDGRSHPGIIAASRGAEPDPLHFYSTSYSRATVAVGPAKRPERAAASAKNETIGNQLAAGKTSGNGVGLTGYTANFRPHQQYSSRADEHDGNTMMKEFCDPALHFSTRTKRDFNAGGRAKEDSAEAKFKPAT